MEMADMDTDPRTSQQGQLSKPLDSPQPLEHIEGHSGGFTLLEALAATLILAIGIMGVAAMQVRSLQTSQNAYARAQAIHIARDFFERLRANPGGYRNTAVYDSVDSEGAAVSGATCYRGASGCAPQQMAQQDVREWTNYFRDADDADGRRPALPGGRGQVSRAPNSNEFTVVVSWTERVAAGEGGPELPTAAPAVTLRARLD